MCNGKCYKTEPSRFWPGPSTLSQWSPPLVHTGLYWVRMELCMICTVVYRCSNHTRVRGKMEVAYGSMTSPKTTSNSILPFMLFREQSLHFSLNCSGAVVAQMQYLTNKLLLHINRVWLLKRRHSRDLMQAIKKNTHKLSFIRKINFTNKKEKLSPLRLVSGLWLRDQYAA